MRTRTHRPAAGHHPTAPEIRPPRPHRPGLAVLVVGLAALGCTEEFPSAGRLTDAATDAEPTRDQDPNAFDCGRPACAEDADPRPADLGRPDQRPPDAEPACLATGPELCGNALDDDCDGQVDEVPADASQPCREGLGVCARSGIITCQSDGRYGCSEAAGQPQAETCNGLDDDCDGSTDEDFGVGEACEVVEVGGCSFPGLKICDLEGQVRCDAGDTDPDGDGFICNDCAPDDAEVNPGAVEICNLKDDDCDGVVDDIGCDCAPVDRGGRPYLFCPEGVTRAAADAICAPYRQVPLEVGHPAEQAFVAFHLRDYDLGLNWWLALRAEAPEGPFAWPSGAPVTYSNWNALEENGVLRLEGEDCAQYTQGAAWVSTDCTLRAGTLCEPPCAPGTDDDGDGFEACGADCDDRNPSVFPGAVESCADGIDNDCDGRVDERC